MLHNLLKFVHSHVIKCFSRDCKFELKLDLFDLINMKNVNNHEICFSDSYDSIHDWNFVN